ncbi:MAG: glycosyltransferase N-terminal domain-containing protein [Desulfosarcinaceae bacterium]
MTRFNARLGIHARATRRAFDGSPCIWLHAVSVGEVGVAQAIVKTIKARLPQSRLAVSVATEQGFARAESLLNGQATCFYAPLDLGAVVRKTLRMVRPQVLAMLETEIWPNLIVTAHQMGARTAILNGRISMRAIRKDRKIRPLMRHTRSHVDVFSMISEHSAAGWARDILNLSQDTPVFVAGSTRHAEEPVLLEAFVEIRRIFPDCVLILAPRHIQRTEQIEQWVREKGLACQRRTSLQPSTRPRTAPVVILDTIGELSAIYSSADFVFCGGSLVRKGGQNVLEPALWEKPVMYGPSMEDFADAKGILEQSGAGFTVHGAAELARLAVSWLKHPAQARKIGRRARHVILSHRGAAEKHARVLLRLLGAGQV